MSTNPKIQSITAHEVYVPGKKGAVNSPELGLFADDWDAKPIVLLEFHISDGTRRLAKFIAGHH